MIRHTLLQQPTTVGQDLHKGRQLLSFEQEHRQVPEEAELNYEMRLGKLCWKTWRTAPQVRL
jgi:hypothetical protein